jgi:hypothetical protein
MVLVEGMRWNRWSGFYQHRTLDAAIQLFEMNPSARTWLRWLILWVVVAATAQASSWQRHVLSGKGESFDAPQAHPLAYFIRDPFLRDDGYEYCGDCAPAGKAAVHVQHRFKTELIKVGTLGGYTIYDLFYRFDDHVDTGEIDWKSILVEVSPGRYREIYHLQPTQAEIKPSFFLKAGEEEILATRDLIPGTGNNYYEDYFWFSPAGPVRIDIETITKAVQSILPSGLGARKGGGLDMKSLSYRSAVWKDDDANCCPSGGVVDIKFRLDNGKIIVTSKHYDPTAAPYD